MPFDEPIECPLCMEPLDIDDLNFFPCTCGYQICRFCWHRIRTDENSLCPACRKQYEEDPAAFKPLTDEELTKIKKERRQKDVARKQKAAENRRHLANIRVVQKNLVFVVGLSTRLAETEVLKRQDYFGKYGKIVKVVINSSTSYAGAQVRKNGPSASAYITYTKPEDCLRAIHAVNNLYVDGRTLKASLGTTKYCSHFLKGTQCTKTDCMYLHELGDEEASFTKEEMQSGKHQDYEQKLVDTYLTPAISHSTPASQVSNPARSSGGESTSVPNGSAVNTISKNGTISQRKKTDSGSSGGSSKAKEPWPLLNSNRNSNQTSVTALKEGGDAVAGSAESRGGTKQNPIRTTDASTSITENTVIKQNGTHHSSPSSSCSTSSNPRTPTPETIPSASPRLPTSTAIEEQSTLNVKTEPTLAPAKTLLAARKLPFSETTKTNQLTTDELAVQHSSSKIHTFTDHSGMNVNAVTSSANIPAQSQSQVPVSFALGREPEWSTALDHALASDDDLGFDPFLESNKGLADMLENEPGHIMPAMLSAYGGGLGLPMHPHRPPPGVGAPPHLQPNGAELFAAGIMSPIVAPSSSSLLPSSVVTNNTSSSLPAPPPGLPAFPQYTRDGGIQQSSTTHVNGIAPDMPAYRGSRMMGLMNLGPSNMSQPQSPLIQQSPVNTMPRSPYNDNRIPPSNAHSTAGGFVNGIADYSNFNTQEMRESLKALLPNASINFAPTHQPLQHSRLRNNYMHPGSTAHNNSSSWNGNLSQPSQMANSGGLDDQFTDPAIVSGCLSSDTSNSPPGAQPHWLKSIQQLTEIESSPIKQPNTLLPMHSMPSMPSVYRQQATQSRMPFAQNIHMSQPGHTSGWPTLQAHNPPPGFQSAFRSAPQNPHMATLES